MKISFNNSLDDIVALNDAQLRRFRETGKTGNPVKGWLILLATIGAVIAFFWWRFEERPDLLIGFTAAIAFYAWLQTAGKTKKRLRIFLAKVHPEGEWRPNIAEVNASGFTHVCHDNVTAFWWPQIVDIQRDTEYLRFYTDQCSVAQIPLRVFRTPEELDRFISEANRLWEAHKNDPPITFPEISGIIEEGSDAPGCVLINPNQPDSPSDTPPAL